MFHKKAIKIGKPKLWLNETSLNIFGKNSDKKIMKLKESFSFFEEKKNKKLPGTKSCFRRNFKI